MAVTKDKFGVPIEGARLGILQPKLKYRFRVIVTGFGAGGRTDEFTSNIVSVTRPTFNVDEVEVHSYNSRAYISGKSKIKYILLIKSVSLLLILNSILTSCDCFNTTKLFIGSIEMLSV